MARPKFQKGNHIQALYWKNHSPEERFLKHLIKGAPDECWYLDVKSRVPNGYVPFNNTYAHRFSYEYFNGKKIPEGMDACHTCDNPPCCNPNHLFEGTRKENMLDAKQKGRMATGINTGPKRQFTITQIIDIRSRRSLGEAYADIAKTFECHPTTIRLICLRKRWSYVT